MGVKDWVFSGKVKRFKKRNVVKIPHMGWNTVRIERYHPVFAEF